MATITKVALVNKGKVVGAGRNKDNSNLASIEATTTASRSYQVGDYLMLQGEFYKVIDDISIGDTLASGTNIQSTNVGDEISNISDTKELFNGESQLITNSEISLNDNIDKYKYIQLIGFASPISGLRFNFAIDLYNMKNKSTQITVFSRYTSGSTDYLYNHIANISFTNNKIVCDSGYRFTFNAQAFYNDSSQIRILKVIAHN